MCSADGNRIQPGDLGILRPETTTSSWTLTIIHATSLMGYIESRRAVRRRQIERRGRERQSVRLQPVDTAIDVQSAKVRAFLGLAYVSVFEVCVSNDSHGQSFPGREGHCNGSTG
jgi:hypothetical protein